MKLAQVALNYGADDLHGTIIEEKIFHMAGSASPQAQTSAQMIDAIRETGRIPVQRDTFYQPLQTFAAGEAPDSPVFKPETSQDPDTLSVK
jgi:aminodeoxyfutalosine synthase